MTIFNHTEDAVPIDFKLDAKASAKLAAPFKATHRHWKGGLYQVIANTRDPRDEAEVGDAVVLYRDEDDNRWCRPEDSFYGTVPRFNVI